MIFISLIQSDTETYTQYVKVRININTLLQIQRLQERKGEQCSTEYIVELSALMQINYAW